MADRLFGKLLGVGAEKMMVLVARRAWLAAAPAPLTRRPEIRRCLDRGPGGSDPVAARGRDLSGGLCLLWPGDRRGQEPVARDTAAAQNLSRPMFAVLLAAFFAALAAARGGGGQLAWLVYVAPFYAIHAAARAARDLRRRVGTGRAGPDGVRHRGCVSVCGPRPAAFERRLGKSLPRRCQLLGPETAMTTRQRHLLAMAATGLPVLLFAAFTAFAAREVSFSVVLRLGVAYFGTAFAVWAVIGVAAMVSVFAKPLLKRDIRHCARGLVN